MRGVRRAEVPTDTMFCDASVRFGFRGDLSRCSTVADSPLSTWERPRLPLGGGSPCRPKGCRTACWARTSRSGIESSERLGRHRWKIERSISWLFGYRRLTVRYERKSSHFLAFLGLAAALTSYKKLAKLTT